MPAFIRASINTELRYAPDDARGMQNSSSPALSP